jgi:hypothetical protein
MPDLQVDAEGLHPIRRKEYIKLKRCILKGRSVK